MRRRDCWGGLAAALGAPGAVWAGPAYQTIALGRNPALPPGELELLVFFSYACGHCDALEAPLAAWLRRQARTLRLRRVPVPFLSNAANYQRLFYALEQLQRVGELHARVFDIVLRSEQDFFDAKEMASALFPGRPALQQALVQQFGSPVVTAKVAAATASARAHGLSATPTLALQGQYLSSPALAGGIQPMLECLEGLMARLA